MQWINQLSQNYSMILHKDAFIKTLSGDAFIINQDLKWLLVAIFEFVTWITLYLIVPELLNVFTQSCIWKDLFWFKVRFNGIKLLQKSFVQIGLILKNIIFIFSELFIIPEKDTLQPSKKFVKKCDKLFISLNLSFLSAICLHALLRIEILVLPSFCLETKSWQKSKPT